MSSDRPWERHADWWQRNFTEGADQEYEEQILPLVDRYVGGGRRVVEVGCGEGQVSRRIARLGADVVGVEPTAELLGLARRRAGGPHFVLGRAEHLPLADASVDTAVLCLVLEHLDPFEPAVDETARVLEDGGRLVVVMNHPLLQAPGSCWVDDADFSDQYWRLGPYLHEQVVQEEVAPGVTLPFAHRPLSRYVHHLGSAGLLLEDMVEPAPAPSVLARLTGFAEADSIPKLLLLVARRRGR